MSQAMLGSNAQPRCNVALTRTYARTDLRRVLAEIRNLLTFRNARARIRISALGIFGSGADDPDPISAAAIARARTDRHNAKETN